MLVQSVDSYRPGPDGFIVDWVKALAAEVDNLIVLTYHYNSKEKLPDNIKVYEIHGRNFLTRNTSLAFMTFRLAKKTDVIFAHILEVFGVMAGFIGKILRKKSVFWYSQGYDFSGKFFPKVALFLVDKIFVSAVSIKESYEKTIGKWVGKKVVILSQGLNLKHYRLGQNVPWPKKGCVIKLLYAGRVVSPVKDIITMLDAVNKVSELGYNVILQIAGGWGVKNNTNEK